MSMCLIVVLLFFLHEKCVWCDFVIRNKCLIKIGILYTPFREYIIDLVGRPGVMSQPDSSLNSASSILISSPLCHPKFKPVETAEYTKTLAQLYFLDSQALHIVFDTTSGYFLCLSGCTFLII